MIFFGHLGITTGVVKICEKTKIIKTSELYNGQVDYRFVLAGSILPDIVDKPIGAFLFRNYFHNSRIFAHSLLFSLIIMLIGIIINYRNKNLNVFILGFSSLIHLVLDSMWFYPGILLWPYFGLKFPQRPEGHWLASDIINLMTKPSVYLPELIGAAIIIYLFSRLIAKNELRLFIKLGKL